MLLYKRYHSLDQGATASCMLLAYSLISLMLSPSSAVDRLRGDGKLFVSGGWDGAVRVFSWPRVRSRESAWRVLSVTPQPVVPSAGGPGPAYGERRRVRVCGGYPGCCEQGAGFAMLSFAHARARTVASVFGICQNEEAPLCASFARRRDGV